MTKAQAILAGLLVLAALAAAQATTTAQSFLRVLEIAGEVQVSARDASIADADVLTLQVTMNTNQDDGISEYWTCPIGYRARVRYLYGSRGNYSRCYAVFGAGFEVALSGQPEAQAGVVLRGGDQLKFQNNATGSSQNYPNTANFIAVIDVVEVQ